MNKATYCKKLIEVALPLEAINKESAREKSIRHGHPSTLHLWWARRPLAACRAVLFASLVDDPSSHPDQFPTEDAQSAERDRLCSIIEQLVKWENSNNADVLAEARAEILKSTNGNLPPVLDPFCGGGSIPLEAQRLGLEAHGSDLNPVAVLITKALIEIPPKFANKPPVNPDSRKKPLAQWYGAQGLAEDVRYYGQWMRLAAYKQIGHLYPKVQLPPSYGSGEGTVIAWLWARTVKCPNPACKAKMPLVRSFALSTKRGKQAWVEPVIDYSQVPPVVSFEVKTGEGKPAESPKTGRGAKFRCLACNQPADDKHIKAEGVAGRMGSQLMAIVAEGKRGRVYLEPTQQQEDIAHSAETTWYPDAQIGDDRRSMFTPLYGLTHFHHLFTLRQLVALTTFSDLVSEAREQVRRDAVAAGMADDGLPLSEGGKGATAYADAVATYLGLAVDKMTDTNTTLCTWQVDPPRLRATFGRQALPMTWDFAEANIFADAAGDYQRCYGSLSEVLDRLVTNNVDGQSKQTDAMFITKDVPHLLISTDPPYYDNIGYADLSDFFYIWLRRSIGRIYLNLFSTLLVPKAQELVATPYRFGGNKKKAQGFFEEGLGKAFSQMCTKAHPDYPLTVYYAFKQTETDDEAGNSLSAISSTGWETMLEGLIRAGFSITGTWPMCSELATRNIGRNNNALSSSIVLVCRPRPESAPSTTRRQFLTSLKRELPNALYTLQQGNIAPVDLAQASIGPGMAIFSRYAKVLESDGTPMRVRTALQLINQTLDEFLTEQEGEFDADTRWALAWFEQYAFLEGLFGDAETLSKAKNTAVQGMVEAGIIVAKAGKVRLLRRDELPQAWNPTDDKRLTVWEATQHLIRALDCTGEASTATLLAQLGTIGEVARDLAYRLYSVCDRKGWASQGVAYNSLVIAWPELTRLAGSRSQAIQGELEL